MSQIVKSNTGWWSLLATPKLPYVPESTKKTESCMKNSKWGKIQFPIHWWTLKEALQDIVYILLPPRCKNYCTTFCICLTPTHRLKVTTTDLAFQWCRLLVLVLWFSPRKCGVCPEKVGKMAFFGCNEFQWTKLTWKLLLELKRNQ